MSELNDVFKSCYYSFPLGYDNVDWFKKEIIRLEKKIFKDTNRYIILTEENEEEFKTNNVCPICEINIEPEKVRDHCHLTSKYRGPAHNNCNINVTQKQSSFIPFIFNIFSNYDCHLFFFKC